MKGLTEGSDASLKGSFRILVTSTPTVKKQELKLIMLLFIFIIKSFHVKSRCLLVVTQNYF